MQPGGPISDESFKEIAKAIERMSIGSIKGHVVDTVATAPVVASVTECQRRMHGQPLLSIKNLQRTTNHRSHFCQTGICTKGQCAYRRGAARARLLAERNTACCRQLQVKVPKPQRLALGAVACSQTQAPQMRKVCLLILCE